MSSHQTPVNTRTVTIDHATLGTLPRQFDMPRGSLHQRLPSAFILMEKDSSVFESLQCDVLDCLVGGSSSTPLLTLCLALKDICLYWVFDPLDPTTRLHLEHFCREQAFPLLTWDGARAIPYVVPAPMFDRGLETTRGRKPASHRDWFAQAREHAGALPGIYAGALPSVARCQDHRVFLMVAGESFHARTVDMLLELSEALKD